MKLTLTDVLAVAGSVMTGLGIIIGVWQFNRANRLNDALEFKRRVWEQKREAYSALGDICGNVLVCKNAIQLDSLATEFDKIYYTQMPMTQDTAVEKKMIAFRMELLDYRDSLTDLNRLKERELLLMRALRKDLQTSWKTIQP